MIEESFSRSLEQFIQTVKDQNNFWQQIAFLTCSWRFLISYKLEQLELFRNMQEKLQKSISENLLRHPKPFQKLWWYIHFVI